MYQQAVEKMIERLCREKTMQVLKSALLLNAAENT